MTRRRLTVDGMRGGLFFLLLALALGCGRPSQTIPPDADADVDIGADADLDAPADGDEEADVGDGDVGDGDADVTPDGDLDEEADADAPPACSCPEPLTACGSIAEVAFSHWDSSLAEQLLQGIACAQSSLDISVYDISSPCLVDALLAAVAANPSLTLRVVTEFDTCGRVDGVLTCELSRLEAAGAGEVVIDTRPSFLMHTKFMIIDGSQAIVSTANWTTAGLCGENNGSVLLDQPALVDALEAEFERFFVEGSFGNTSWAEPISEDGVDLYFSPTGDDWQDELVRRIDEADGAVSFMIFSFTREDLAQAMIDAAARGVEVRGLIAPRFFTATYPAVQLMVDAGLALRVADVHHKTVLIESGAGDTLETGSGNLSGAARDHNNEVVLFFNDHPALFEAFSDEFERVWASGVVGTLGE